MRVVFYFISGSLSYSFLLVGWYVPVYQMITWTDALNNIMLTDLQLTPEMYNQLRGLQKKAKDLRQEVRNLRRMSQAQAHSVRETIRDTFMKIRWGYVIDWESSVYSVGKLPHYVENLYEMSAPEWMVHKEIV